MSGITYEGFLYICYGAAAISALLLITAVILFFALKIPGVIGDLTGATARKAIAQIRDQNEAGGPKAYHPSPVNQERGKITDKIGGSGGVIRNPSQKLAGYGTSKLNTAHLQQQAAADQTTLLDQNQTMVLDQSQTSVLDQGQTMVLDQNQAMVSDAGQTAVLDQTQMPAQALWTAPVQAVDYQPVQIFSVDYEITFIHTNEQIR